MKGGLGRAVASSSAADRFDEEATLFRLEYGHVLRTCSLTARLEKKPTTSLT